jgi:hypothetical protein
VVWRNRDEAGLAFGNPRRLNDAIPLDAALRLRASERARKKLQLRIEQLGSEH